MLAAAALLPVRVLLTLGGVVPIDAVDPPPNVTVREFVPHELVLPHMAAVVSHGGMSTITTALAAGVPLVCIPQGREQPINASRVAACGIGRVLAPDASAAEIAAAVEATLPNTHMRRSARRFAELIDGLGRGATATDHIARLHSPHQPHLRRAAPAN
jgi:UDP:flavonoid glycosyltransferase YjiC (YdhE family)